MGERDGGRVSGAGERGAASGAVRAARSLTEERRGVVIPSIIFENIPPSPVDFFFDIDGRINSLDVSEKGLAIAHNFDGDDSLAILDPCAGTMIPLGPHGSNGIGGIAFGPDEKS